MAIRIEHRLGVKAPASVIWGVIHDLARWPEWNPLYPEVAGRIGYGETLKLKLALPDQPERELVATVTDWTPDEALHWRTSHFGGLVRTVRFLEIEAMSEAGCIFSNGEIFSGLLSGSVVRQLRPSLKKGFESLGEALCERAEALWRDEEPETTLGRR
jgi:hypothetical protein